LSCAKRPGLLLHPGEVEPYDGPVTIEVLKDSHVFKKFRTLRSEVKVKAMRGRKRLGRYQGALVYERPGSVRLRVYGPMGATGVDAVHSGGVLQILLPQRNYLYEGAAPLPEPEKLLYSMEDDGKRYTLYAFKPGDGDARLHAAYTFDRRTLLNTGITLYREGEGFLRMQFAGFAGNVPHLAMLDLFNGYSMEIELLEPETDSDISPEFFEHFEHEGLKVLPLKRILKGDIEGR
jgi:hypothetical protein